MTITKTAELESKIELRVTDYISKKQYFQDSCVIGWVFVQEGEKVSLHHLYLEEKELADNQIERIEFINFEWEEQFEEEKEKIKLEAELQGVYGELSAALKDQFNIVL